MNNFDNNTIQANAKLSGQGDAIVPITPGAASRGPTGPTGVLAPLAVTGPTGPGATGPSWPQIVGPTGPEGLQLSGNGSFLLESIGESFATNTRAQIFVSTTAVTFADYFGYFDFISGSLIAQPAVGTYFLLCVNLNVGVTGDLLNDVYAIIELNNSIEFVFGSFIIDSRSNSTSLILASTQVIIMFPGDEIKFFIRSFGLVVPNLQVSGTVHAFALN